MIKGGIEYDFLDFGSSTGGSMEFCRKHLGGKRGLGVDLDPRKIRRLRDSGYDGIIADVTELDLPSESVRFVMMSHFLEHLPGLPSVEKSLAAASRVATDFLYIRGPYFDADEHLESKGLKYYWSDWTGHPCHLMSWQLERILRKQGLRHHSLMCRNPVPDSNHDSIHPLSSPRDQHGYDPAIHPPKPFTVFDPPLFRELVCCVRLRPFKQWQNVLNTQSNSFPLVDHRKSRRYIFTLWKRFVPVSRKGTVGDGRTARSPGAVPSGSGNMLCNVCGSHEFVDVNGRKGVLCSHCQSFERTRALMMFLTKLETPKPGMKMLHIAPERGLAERFVNIVGEDNYYPRGNDPSKYKFCEAQEFDLCKDAEHLPADFFDLIVHSHIMEHIPCDYMSVLCHIHRSLRPDGLHVCCIPVLSGRYDKTTTRIGGDKRIQQFSLFNRVRRIEPEGWNSSRGMIFKHQPAYDLEQTFSVEDLDRFNIPGYARKGFTPNTIFVFRKEDIQLAA